MHILDKDSFEEEVLKSNGWVLVDFWGPKCEPCKALMPKVEALADEYGDKVKFCKLDTTGNMRLAISQKVMALPAILFYKDGVEESRLGQDEATADAIENKLKEITA